jgi:ABC-type Mn2+/Zn2+ transport system ATPase subunit
MSDLTPSAAQPGAPPIPTAPLIEVRGVNVSYGAETVLDHVSVTVRPGEFVGIVGPSGAGKSSLLKAMLGTVPVHHGSIVRQPGLRVGYVPQLETVDWNFPVTVRDVVLLAAHRTAPWPWVPKALRVRADELLEQLGVGGLGDRHIRALSGGQQQRVFLARALFGSPNVLMLDEPTSGVDVKTRHEVLHLLGDLNESGLAVVLTTHDLNGIAAHLPRLLCINRRVIGEGPPSAVLTPSVLEATYGAPMDVLDHMGVPMVVERVPLRVVS